MTDEEMTDEDMDTVNEMIEENEMMIEDEFEERCEIIEVAKGVLAHLQRPERTDIGGMAQQIRQALGSGFVNVLERRPTEVELDELCLSLFKPVTP